MARRGGNDLPAKVEKLIQRDGLLVMQALAAYQAERLCLGQICALLDVTADEWKAALDALSYAGVCAFSRWRTRADEEDDAPLRLTIREYPDE